MSEESLTDALARTRAESLAADIRRDLAAVDAYTEEHGSFAELVRAHYGADDGAV
jgi:hypothetical protein